MPSSVTSVFSEPEDFEAALREEGCLGLVITGRGHFQARLTQIALRRIRLSAGEEQLARVAFIGVPADMVFISLPVGNGSSPIYGGVRMQVGEIMTLGPAEHLHVRTDGVSRWGTIQIPVNDLTEYGRALTGAAFNTLSVIQDWRPLRAADRHLHSLHAAAIRMAAQRPQLLADAETARGLEQQLIEAVVECISADGAGADTGSRRRTQDIMVRFEQLLQQRHGQTASMRETCAALGVSGRLVRSLCAQHLGISPAAYDRRLRMASIRRALRLGAPEIGSISAIARHYGFRDPGRFAINYRAAYGEVPSATLRRARAGRERAPLAAVVPPRTNIE
jgi:AraC-like DNA-binding protein